MQFDAVAQALNTTRLGTDARYTFAPGRWLFGGSAWAHQFEPNSPQVTGTLVGLFPEVAPGTAVDENWLETTGGVHWAFTKDINATGSLTLAAYPHSAARYIGSISLTKSF
jgi:hypothetical protein